MFLMKVPGAQLAGSGTEQPNGHVAPDGHGRHAAAPVLGAYESSGHEVHRPLPSPRAKLPAVHTMGAVAPATQKLPSGHAVHSDGSARSVAVEKEPEGHGSAALAASPQKWPGVHRWHAVDPSASWKVPGAHLVHVSCLSLLLYVPALQLAAVPLPTGQ